MPGIMPGWSRIKHYHPDAIYFVNYADGLTQLNGIDISRAVVDTHDLLFLGYSLSKNEPVWRPGVLRRFRKEISLLNSTALVIAIARNEHTFFELILKGPQTRYVPPHMTRVANLREDSAIAADLLFLGSTNKKNVHGINAFLSEYRNWKSFPSLIIAGKVSAHINPELSHVGSIEIKGYVQDLPSLYRSIRAVICPVEGTGINIKVMEALAYGKPVFASSSCIAGLPPGSESCVFALTEESISRFLGDARLLEQASRAAYDYVDGPFIRQSWSSLHDMLRDLVRYRQVRRN